MVYKARRYRENFGDGVNKVDNCIANAWIRFSHIDDDDRIISFQAVYFNCPSGSLQIRDAYSDVIYNTTVAITMTQPDILNYPLTVRLPLEYFASVSGSSIRIFGEYV